MAPVNRNAPVVIPTVNSAAAETAPAPANTEAKPYKTVNNRRDLDEFETSMNTEVQKYQGQEIKNLRKDVSATMGGKMLDALLDPAAARQELSRGVIGTEGEVIRQPPEKGSPREKLLQRVANGEKLSQDEIMKEADDVRKKTGASRMVWDMIYSAMLATMKAEKKQW